jgi:hypothetical protein
LIWVSAQQSKTRDKLFDAISRLEELGFELRRPEAEYLGNEIYELRIRKGHVNYRPLYFFDDLRDKAGNVVQRRAVIVHGCTKEGKVDTSDIATAIARRKRYLTNRASHTYVSY